MFHFLDDRKPGEMRDFLSLTMDGALSQTLVGGPGPRPQTCPSRADWVVWDLTVAQAFLPELECLHRATEP